MVEIELNRSALMRMDSGGNPRGKLG
jgi:hypothetical protein